MLHLLHDPPVHHIAIGQTIIGRAGLNDRSQQKGFILCIVKILQNDMAVHIWHPIRRAHIGSGGSIQKASRIGG